MSWISPLILVIPALALVVVGVAFSYRRPPPVAMHQHSGAHPRNAWRRYAVRFAVLILAFVAFDMEMAFMYPWGVAFRRMGMMAFGDMLVFVAILGVAVVYLWRTGVFDLESSDRP